MPDDVGIVLGSGFADLALGRGGGGATTRWGDASAPLLRWPAGGRSAWALPRHGLRQDIPAHAINYRANIALLHEHGVRRVIGLNTVGVISSVCRPGQLALPHQLVDYSWGRATSYFDGGAAGLRHIEFTEPFAPALRAGLLAAASRAGIPCAERAVYAVTQGPRLETAAEIDRYERDGADLVGMTAMPEAALAAELDMQYACLALVVNAAAGRGASPIHAEVRAHAALARDAALAVLAAFLDGADARAARS